MGFVGKDENCAFGVEISFDIVLVAYEFLSSLNNSPFKYDSKIIEINKFQKYCLRDNPFTRFAYFPTL